MPLWSKVANIFRTARHNREIDEELAIHIAMREEDNRRRGMSPADARRDAELRLGNSLLERERARDAGILRWLDTLMQDLRYAVRTLSKTPVLTAVVILSLALGIGANTAIFSLTHALLLRSLPVADPQRLYSVLVGRNDSLTNPIWEDLRDHQDAFTSAFAWASQSFDSSQGGETRPVPGAMASGAVFRTLGLEPSLGRLFTEDDDKVGGGSAGPVAVLGYDYWTRAYGADPGVLGRTLRLNGKPFQIVGVAPEGFHGVIVGQTADVIIPLGTEAWLQGKESILQYRSYWWLNVMGRLKPEYTEKQAAERLQALARGVMERTAPPEFKPEDARGYLNSKLIIENAARGASDARNEMRTPMLVLTVVVGLVLLIACANVANLLLARAASRRREIAVRIAMGASRARVIRQVLTESLVLACAGGALGIALAPTAARLLLRGAATARDEVFLDLHPDLTVLAFTAAVAVLCGLLFGAAPAWRASHVAPQTGLYEGSGAAGDRRGRLRSALVAVQVALSLVLLTASGLFFSSLRNLVRVDLGFEPQGVLLVNVDQQLSGVPLEQRPAFGRQLLDQLRQAPGILSASASHVTPLAGMTWSNYSKVDSPQGAAKRVYSFFNAVSPGYFQTLQTPLLAGRDISGSDTPSSTPVAVVNEEFAKQAFDGANPVGRRLVRDVYARGVPPKAQTVEIVGLVRNAKYRSLREPAPPTIYLALDQHTGGPPSLRLQLRARSNPESLPSVVRAATAAVNPRTSYTLRYFSRQVRDASMTERFIATLCTTFGALAVLLAAIGLYGVLAYSVTQRRGEIGIRIALGATPGHIRRWVLRQSTLTVIAGALAGVVLAFWSARFAGKILYGVKPDDFRIYAAGLGVLLAIAALASYLPARRATRLDPVRALRHE